MLGHALLAPPWGIGRPWRRLSGAAKGCSSSYSLAGFLFRFALPALPAAPGRWPLSVYRPFNRAGLSTNPPFNWAGMLHKNRHFSDIFRTYSGHKAAQNHSLSIIFRLAALSFRFRARLLAPLIGLSRLPAPGPLRSFRPCRPGLAYPGE